MKKNFFRFRFRCRRLAAFSLMEVNMAVLVMAGGLLALITLFPAGLRMSTASVGDTRISLFANDALNSLHAKALSVEKSYWMGSAGDFWKKIIVDTPLQGHTVTTGTEYSSPSQNYIIIRGEISDYFSGSGGSSGLPTVPVRYQIRLHRLRSTAAGMNDLGPLEQHLNYMTWRISISATDRPDLALDKVPFNELPVYHTEVRYQGML